MAETMTLAGDDEQTPIITRGYESQGSGEGRGAERRRRSLHPGRQSVTGEDGVVRHHAHLRGTTSDHLQRISLQHSLRWIWNDMAFSDRSTGLVF